jgi:hypothetical protein
MVCLKMHLRLCFVPPCGGLGPPERYNAACGKPYSTLRHCTVQRQNCTAVRKDGSRQPTTYLKICCRPGDFLTDCLPITAAARIMPLPFSAHLLPFTRIMQDACLSRSCGAAPASPLFSPPYPTPPHPATGAHSHSVSSSAAWRPNIAAARLLSPPPTPHLRPPPSPPPHTEPRSHICHLLAAWQPNTAAARLLPPPPCPPLLSFAPPNTHTHTDTYNGSPTHIPSHLLAACPEPSALAAAARLCCSPAGWVCDQQAATAEPQARPHPRLHDSQKTGGTDVSSCINIDMCATAETRQDICQLLRIAASRRLQCQSA